MGYKTLSNKVRIVKTKIGLKDYYFVRDLNVKDYRERGAFVNNKDGTLRLFKTKKEAMKIAKKKR